MSTVMMSTAPSASGFDFGNYARNTFLSNAGMGGFTATSTGTTIVGCVFKDGVVLGADTRATEGPIVADKNCEKIHYISDNIRCCGAGTAADTEFVTALISSNMQLHELNTGRQPRVVTAMTMLKQRLFQYQGQIGAALVLGGFDATGPHLFTVAPHGSTDKLPYVTMGSGSLAAMAVFESGWQKDMSRADAVALVAAAISSGIFNDLGSGSNVDVCIIEKNKTDYLRNYEMPNERVQKEQRYAFPKGTTAFTKEQIYNMVQKEGMSLPRPVYATCARGPQTGLAFRLSLRREAGMLTTHHFLLVCQQMCSRSERLHPYHQWPAKRPWTRPSVSQFALPSLPTMYLSHTTLHATFTSYDTDHVSKVIGNECALAGEGRQRHVGHLRDIWSAGVECLFLDGEVGWVLEGNACVG
jgi:20S proteasome subunit beta 2